MSVEIRSSRVRTCGTQEPGPKKQAPKDEITSLLDGLKKIFEQNSMMLKLQIMMSQMSQANSDPLGLGLMPGLDGSGIDGSGGFGGAGFGGFGGGSYDGSIGSGPFGGGGDFGGFGGGGFGEGGFGGGMIGAGQDMQFMQQMQMMAMQQAIMNSLQPDQGGGDDGGGGKCGTTDGPPSETMSVNLADQQARAQAEGGGKKDIGLENRLDQVNRMLQAQIQG